MQQQVRRLTSFSTNLEQRKYDMGGFHFVASPMCNASHWTMEVGDIESFEMQEGNANFQLASIRFRAGNVFYRHGPVD